MRYDVDLAVVGAGPQALTLLSYLGKHCAETLAATAVFDPEDWLTVRADHVVCATGSRTHVRLEPMLRRCR